ncbi:hypothetical protein GGF31_001826 [Allomyces arbusculus]|nr:hypothetical protein GGF31_001826 [Allomyces arbusculus]
MTTPNLLQPRHPAATLDRMPPFVLTRIATALLDGESAHDAVPNHAVPACVLRGADRAVLPLRDKLVRGRDRTVKRSRKWSLLPVPIDQHFQCTVDESHIIAAVYAGTAWCRSLTLDSKKISWRYVPSLPLSLVKLRLDEIPALVVGGGAHGAVFAQLLPHGLRKLVVLTGGCTSC